VGAELFHEGRRTDGQTDMTKLTVAFRNWKKLIKFAHIQEGSRSPVTLYIEYFASSVKCHAVHKVHRQAANMTFNDAAIY
jgi:hypothetical protein